jgi:hypothetical protein
VGVAASMPGIFADFRKGQLTKLKIKSINILANTKNFQWPPQQWLSPPLLSPERL